MSADMKKYDELQQALLGKLQRESWAPVPSTTLMVSCPLCGAAVPHYGRTTHISWHSTEMDVTRALLMPYDRLANSRTSSDSMEKLDEKMAELHDKKAPHEAH